MAYRLSADLKVRLLQLSVSVGRVDKEALQLELKGLVQTGRGRFGDWARLTEAGRAKAIQLQPVAPAGSVPTDGLLRGAAPRTRRKAAPTRKNDATETASRA